MKVSIIILFIFLTGCTPEQEATEFNKLNELVAGENMSLKVQEDTPLLIEYNLPTSEANNIRLEISSHPKNGVLNQCEKVSSFKFKCEYMPEQNYNGEDSFSLRIKDGDLVSKQDSVISIDVVAVNDNPTALSKAYSGKENELINFSAPLGKDIDSSANNLKYKIVQGPENGVLSNCFEGQGTRSCTYLANEGFRGSETLKYIIEDNESGVSNEAELLVQVTDPDTTTATEIFTQGVSNIDLVEIVWVVDNSGSMGDDQNTLKNNFQSFINNFVVDGKSKFPFNMGVITSDTYTDGYQNKAFSRDGNGNIYNLSSQKAEVNFDEFKSDFEKAVLVGINGSGIEKSLDSISKSRQYNPSWYSEQDSLLVFIILSDEREQSYNSSTVKTQELHEQNIDSWITTLNDWKTEEQRIKIFPIVRESQDSFNRYKMMAEKTDSTLYDISSPFNSILDNISTKVANLVNSFPLINEYIIEKETIKIYVNDTITTDWNLIDEAVTFTAPPVEGATIKVVYEYYERNL